MDHKTCAVCEHPEREAIENALRRVGRGASYDGLKGRYEVSVARMRRHRKEGHAVGGRDA